MPPLAAVPPPPPSVARNPRTSPLVGDVWWVRGAGRVRVVALGLGFSGIAVSYTFPPGRVVHTDGTPEEWERRIAGGTLLEDGAVERGRT